MSGNDEDLGTVEWLLAIFCSGIACILGLIWLIQGKPKGGKMLGVTFLFAIMWGILNVVVRMALMNQ